MWESIACSVGKYWHATPLHATLHDLSPPPPCEYLLSLPYILYPIFVQKGWKFSLKIITSLSIIVIFQFWIILLNVRALYKHTYEYFWILLLSRSNPSFIGKLAVHIFEACNKIFTIHESVKNFPRNSLNHVRMFGMVIRSDFWHKIWTFFAYFDLDFWFRRNSR